MGEWIRHQLGRRPWWMNAMLLFCACMALVYVPWDLFVKPVARRRGGLVRHPLPRLGGEAPRASALGGVRRRPGRLLAHAALDAPVGGGLRGADDASRWWSGRCSTWRALSRCVFAALARRRVRLDHAACCGARAACSSRRGARCSERYGDWALVTGASAGIGARVRARARAGRHLARARGAARAIGSRASRTSSRSSTASRRASSPATSPRPRAARVPRRRRRSRPRHPREQRGRRLRGPLRAPVGRAPRGDGAAQLRGAGGAHRGAPAAPAGARARRRDLHGLDGGLPAAAAARALRRDQGLRQPARRGALGRAARQRRRRARARARPDRDRVPGRPPASSRTRASPRPSVVRVGAARARAAAERGVGPVQLAARQRRDAAACRAACSRSSRSR